MNIKRSITYTSIFCHLRKKINEYSFKRNVNYRRKSRKTIKMIVIMIPSNSKPKWIAICWKESAQAQSKLMDDNLSSDYPAD